MSEKAQDIVAGFLSDLIRRQPHSFADRFAEVVVRIKFRRPRHFLRLRLRIGVRLSSKSLCLVRSA